MYSWYLPVSHLTICHHSSWRPKVRTPSGPCLRCHATVVDWEVSRTVPSSSPNAPLCQPESPSDPVPHRTVALLQYKPTEIKGSKTFLLTKNMRIARKAILTMNKNLDWKFLCFNIAKPQTPLFFKIARPKRRISQSRRKHRQPVMENTWGVVISPQHFRYYWFVFLS